MKTSHLTIKGQVVIPKEIRAKYGIVPGTRVGFVEKDGEIVVRALTKAYFESLAGWLTGGGNVLKQLIKDKKREIQDDKKRSLR